MKLTGNKVLKVRGSDDAIRVKNNSTIDLSGFTGKLISTPGWSSTALSKADTASITLPASYRYNINKDDTKPSDDTILSSATPYVYDGVKMRYLEINCAPYAIINPVSIDGYQNSQITEQEITINIGGDTFKELYPNAPVTEWFKNYSGSFSAFVLSNTANSVTIEINGILNTVNTDPISITIPSDKLTGGKEIQADTNPSAVWNIIAPLPEISHKSVSVSDSFAMNVFVDTAQFNVGGTYDGYKAYVEYRPYGAAGAESQTSTIENGDIIAAGPLYEFNAVTSVVAKDLGVKFQMCLVAVAPDNSETKGEWVEVSVEQYLREVISMPESTAKEKTLCTDILNYGAAAQTYFNWSTENLVNKDVDQANATPGDAGSIKTALDDKTVNPDPVTALSGAYTYIGTSLLLKDKVIIRHYFTYTGEGSPSGANHSSFDTIPNRYNYESSALTPLDFNTQQSIEIGGTMTLYSVNNYIYKVLSGSYEDDLKNLMIALYKYGVSAEAYVSTP